MKKILAFILTLSVVLSSFVIAPVSASSSISVTIDGVAQSYDVMPEIIDGRTFVPMRGIFEALGASIEWDADSSSVTATRGAKTVVVKVNSPFARVDGQAVSLDVPAQIINGRTMVPVRFVAEALGENVAWDAQTGTVIITSDKNHNLKRLSSDVHRNVPDTFYKTSEMYDFEYFDIFPYTDDEIYADIEAEPAVMIGMDDFMPDGLAENDPYGKCTRYQDENGDPVVRFDMTQVAEKSASCIYRFKKTIAGLIHTDDVVLLKFKMRTVSGGNEQGVGKIQIQLESQYTNNKDIWQIFEAGSEWTTHYYAYYPYKPYSEMLARVELGIRPAFHIQSIEIKDFELLNYGHQVDMAKMPSVKPDYTQLAEGLKWRNDANANIEKNRKGDFKIVVEDSNGNPINGAQVELDMFEHEFKFGSVVDNRIISDETYRSKVNSLFNTAVEEESLYWNTYEVENGSTFKSIAEAAKSVGIKTFKGNGVISEKETDENGVRILPEDVVALATAADTDSLRERVQNHINKVVGENGTNVDEWFVENESIKNKVLRRKNGSWDLTELYYKAAKNADPGAELYYNEKDYNGSSGVVNTEVKLNTKVPTYSHVLDIFLKRGIDFDGIGLQSHHDGADQSMIELLELYTYLDERYGNKKIEISEFSCRNMNAELQASFLRDFMVAMFSHPTVDGFIVDGFLDDANSDEELFFDASYSPKLAYDQYADLVYNKWWTRDAKKTTNAEGAATIRGFYGDYDVTVTVGDKTKTVSCAFGKGYDNTLYITME